MPKPLLNKLIAQATIGILCVIIGVACWIPSHDRILLLLSFALGICCLVRTALLHRMICRQEYDTLNGTITKQERSMLGRSQQILIIDSEGIPHQFTLEKNIPLLAGHRYRLYFQKDTIKNPDPAIKQPCLLGFEEIPAALPESHHNQA